MERYGRIIQLNCISMSSLTANTSCMTGNHGKSACFWQFKVRDKSLTLCHILHDFITSTPYKENPLVIALGTRLVILKILIN